MVGGFTAERQNKAISGKKGEDQNDKEELVEGKTAGERRGLGNEQNDVE